MTDPKIKYDIEAAVKGEASVEQLAQALRGLGDTLEGDLKTQATAAADALQALGAKQSAVENFAALRRETADLSQSLDGATARVDELGKELPQAATATRQFAEAETAARQALNSTNGDMQNARTKLRELREEYQGTARRTDEYREANTQLRTSVGELRKDLTQKRQELVAATGATKTAQTAEKGLNAEYQNSVTAARNVSAQLGERNRALESSRVTMQSLGVATTNLAQTERNLQTAVAAARAEVQTLVPAFRAAAEASTASTRVQVQNQRTLREGMQSISTQLAQIQQLATVAVGGSYVGGMLRDVAETADAYKNLSARLQIATGDLGNTQQTLQAVAEVALRTSSVIDDTGTLFARLAKAGQEAGLSANHAQLQAMGLTETINQAVQLSGSSADASKAALTQLIQGLQSGVLRGEEFNSVMEQAPRLAQALAQGLGVTTGELRKMADQGALTSTTVIRALTSQSDAVAAEFGKLPQTVGRALQNLSTQWTLYVGQADNGMASSASAAKIIQALSENLDVLVSTLYAAGKAWAAIKIAGLAVDVAKWATATLSATAATQASTVATVANTTAQVANAAATNVAATAHIVNAAAQARSAAAGTIANAANIKSWGDLGTAVKATTITQSEAARATVRATEMHGVAAAQMAASASTVQKAGIVWRGFTGLLGPVGIAAAVLAPEIAGLARAAGEGIASWTGWGQVLAENERLLRLQDEQLKVNTESMLRQAAVAEEVKNKQFDLTKSAVGLVGQFDELRKKGESAADAISKIGKDFDVSNVAGIKDAASVLDKLVHDGKLGADEFRSAWAKALDGQDLQRFQINARSAFKIAETAAGELVEGSNRGFSRLQQVLDVTLREAVRRVGLDFDNLAGGIGDVARKSINDLDVIVSGLDRLRERGADVGAVLSQSLTRAVDTADSQKAIDAVRERIESLRTALGDRITDGLLQQAAQQADNLKARLEDAKAGIQSAGEAMRFFGLQSQEALQRAADQSREAYDVLRTTGTATATQLRDAFVRTAEDAIKANKGIAPAWLDGEAAVRGLRVRVDEFGRACVEAAGNGGKAFQAFGGHVRESTAELERQAEALDKINAKYGQSKADGVGRYSAPDTTSIVGTSREDRLKGQNAVDNNLVFSVRDKLRAGTLGAGDAGDIQAVITALKQNEVINRDIDRMNPGALGLEGRASAAEMRQLRTHLTNFLDSQGAADGSTPAKQAQVVKLDITLDKRNYGAVSTDAAGSAVLQQLLRDLADAKGRS